MTCIIGVIDREDNSVWVGGDSLGSNGHTKSIELQPKVFRRQESRNVVIGSTSSFRHIDLLRYGGDLFSEVSCPNHESMVMNVVPKMIALFNEGVNDDRSEGKGASLIIGIDNKLYEIQDDYSVLEPAMGFCSVGSGEEVAMGSLITTSNLDIPISGRIALALEAAEKYCCSVQRPFTIINTKSDKVITIE